jgi:uncharacterized protein YcbX
MSRPESRSVTWLGLHPVKSTAIRPLTSTRVERAGFADDRRWMVVDAAGELVSARELHQLFTVVADTRVTDPDLGPALRLHAPGVTPLDVDEPDSDLIDVTLFRSKHLQARPATAEVSAWLEAATGRAGLRLVWCDDPTRRALNPEYAEPGDHTGFADGYPVSLASLASLRQLNDWITEGALARGDEPPEALPIQRFRPNVVMDGIEPFEEDTWTRVRIGEVVFRRTKLIDRCVMTTISVADLRTGPEPIRTLAKHRRWDGATWFAVHLVPDNVGRIAIGDPVEPWD